MGKSATFDSDLLNLIFAAKPISQLCDNAASSALTALAIALHTADPTTAGNQTSNEAAYSGYARQTVARTTAGWTITNNSVTPNAAISFPQSVSSSTSTITYASVGLSTSGTGKIFYSGALSPVINISQNVTPQLSTASAITES